MTGRTLVAGVGNVFQRDDAFGVEVVRLLAGRPRQDGVEIADFGIRGVHLVYELLDGCDLFVLVDAARRGYPPGTVTVLEVGPEDAAAPSDAAVVDAHGLSPDGVFAMIASLGGHLGRSLLVACEPADLSAGMGLSGPVRAALPHAVRAVEEILGGTQREEKEGADDGIPADQGGNHSGGARGHRGFAAGHQALHRDQANVAVMAVVTAGKRRATRQAAAS